MLLKARAVLAAVGGAVAPDRERAGAGERPYRRSFTTAQ
jgi:hypothetical protein